MKGLIAKTLNFMRPRVNLFVGIAFIILGIIIYLLSYSEAPGVSDWSLTLAFFPRLAATFVVGLSLLLIFMDVVFASRRYVSIVRIGKGVRPRFSGGILALFRRDYHVMSAPLFSDQMV